MGGHFYRDFPQCVKVFLHESLCALVIPIQADTRIDNQVSLPMIVDGFNVDSYCSERRCSNHRLLNDTGRTAGRESEVTFGENRERHFRMLAQSRQRFTTPLQSEQDPTISGP